MRYREILPIGNAKRTDRLLGKGFKGAAWRPRGQKGARHVWGSSEERNPLREEGTKSFAIASLAPSLARTAKRKNPSNRIQNRQLKS